MWDLSFFVSPVLGGVLLGCATSSRPQFWWRILFALLGVFIFISRYPAIIKGISLLRGRVSNEAIVVSITLMIVVPAIFGWVSAMLALRYFVPADRKSK